MASIFRIHHSTLSIDKEESRILTLFLTNGRDMKSLSDENFIVSHRFLNFPTFLLENLLLKTNRNCLKMLYPENK